ncbi:hypothetical protein D5018_17360 [Parashewanella curva]|uniref:Uncharacterized protein n=1 Tax=Parashewanella curva TaxID=2338552 RepID=A0A3L8PSQ0_9GAMM|nr:hypothetical protein [Parashewanella curva]RLV58447.1 hypothetical protein D5018_17360 [Parashewanella curva]
MTITQSHTASTPLLQSSQAERHIECIAFGEDSNRRVLWLKHGQLHTLSEDDCAFSSVPMSEA